MKKIAGGLMSAAFFLTLNANALAKAPEIPFPQPKNLTQKIANFLANNGDKVKFTETETGVAATYTAYVGRWDDVVKQLMVEVRTDFLTDDKESRIFINMVEIMTWCETGQIDLYFYRKYSGNSKSLCKIAQLDDYELMQPQNMATDPITGTISTLQDHGKSRLASKSEIYEFIRKRDLILEKIATHFKIN